MKSKQMIRIFFLMVALLTGAASEAWALGESDIIIDPTIDNTQGRVVFKSIAEDGKTVTITVTPTSDYYLKDNANIIVYKLVSPSNAMTRSDELGFPIADRLVVTGPVENTTYDYQFIVPDGYAGAWVSAEFTPKSSATAKVTAKDLTYNQADQELVTLGTVTGGSGEGCVTYSLTGAEDSYTTTIPKATDAGTYTVYYKIAPDDAHLEGSGNVEVEIKKAPLTSVTIKESVIATGQTVQVKKVYAGDLEVPADDYTLSGHEATTEGNYTVTATAKLDSEDPLYHNNYTGSATADYRIVAGGVIRIPDDIAPEVNPSNLGGHYVLTEDVDASVFAGLYSTESEVKTFTGTLEGVAKADGTFPIIDMSDYGHALFDKINGGTVKNIVLKNVKIESGTNVGAIANEMTGTYTPASGDDPEVNHIASIYNCGVLSGSVSGTGKVGGLVGVLGQIGGTDATNANCYARVINCYSFATVSGGTDKGGIVGYNSYTSKAGDIRTMVMNCMFYGSISSGDNVSPVYGGLNINNLNGTETGLNTYNYYRYETNKNITSGKYNCALAAKDQYLKRFELYRQLLNSNRKLAALYATGDADKGVGENNEMAKWVLDKSIAPYPILKEQAYYPSVVNYDPVKYYDDSGTEVQRSSVTERNKGKILGKLTVNISAGSHGSIKTDKSQITLKRLDKDYGNYNFNYDKVQLPYFNEVGDGNYTDGLVVTGWKVTVSGGSNSYTSSGSDVTFGSDGTPNTPYNFADRKCTEKDNYANSKRVFSQGAYFDVPYGVTSINIEAYWGKAAYICDKNYDVVYKDDFTNPKDVDVLSAGEQKNSLLATGQTIYHVIGDNNTGALASLTGVDDPTVYDYALVLVGNLHLNAVPSNGPKPFTIMSADFDNDNEPDYSLIYSHPERKQGAVSPIRFDFINVPGTAMAQKPNTASKFLNVSIFRPTGWFEITNTCQIVFTQFEYDNGGKTAAPLILLGGEYEQIVSTQNTNLNADNYKNRTTYIHVGSNAYFKEFNNGTHSDGWYATPHVPISATGGDYDKFYLSGAYRADAQVAEDDAEGYLSGGRFGEVAGAGQQQIDGNVYWQIYDADITDFYGGGVNSEKPITGNIRIDMFNSHVTTYCGGPKFGDMRKKNGTTIITYSTNKPGTTTDSRTVNIDKDRTVTTNATGCTFGNFYGAGYGGISYVRKRTHDNTAVDFTKWAKEYTDNRGNYFDGVNTSIGSTSERETAGPGVAVDFDYEFFVWSDGRTGGRFYIKYASLSFATTNGVTSTLNDCDITGSFYGGGRLGKVDGTINSTLNGCRVTGNVFGAGYSADKPKVPYRDGGFTTLPKIDTNAGVFADGVKSTTVSDLELNPGQTLNNGESAIGTSGKIDTNFTEADLNALGTVSGVVTLNVKNYISGSNTIPTAITGNVYGGGAMSAATSNVFVNISGNSTVNNVYGGGDLGAVGGNTTVTLKGNAVINGNVFGGGNEAPVSGSATVNIEE